MNALIVVAKRPTPGETKTRLTKSPAVGGAPPLTPKQATRLYEAFLCDTLDLIRQVPDVRPIIAYLPEDAENYFRALAPDFDLRPQHGADLGERLDNALTHYLADGHPKAVIMDSDSPTLPARCLIEAFERLDEADVTLGPCDDGGYYLIGLKRPAPRLLREVQMSTAHVVRDTLALAAAEQLTVAQLSQWYDVDTAAELHRLRDELISLPVERARHTRRVLSEHTETQA
jgi:rSAM/selenodomain-associated transferase 1